MFYINLHQIHSVNDRAKAAEIVKIADECKLRNKLSSLYIVLTKHGLLRFKGMTLDEKWGRVYEVIWQQAMEFFSNDEEHPALYKWVKTRILLALDVSANEIRSQS
jgi:hypothetical protein